MRFCGILACLVASIGRLPGAETRLACIADAWIESPPWEARRGPGLPGSRPHGTEQELALNGRNDFALLDFDFSAVRGRPIRKATLRVHRRPAPVPLLMVGLSTVSGSAKWDESSVTWFTAGRQPWSYAGSDITDVTFGLGGSLYDYVKPRDAGDGWWEIEVPTPMANLMATGDQFGLMLTDEKGQTHTRHTLSSREGAHPPVLVVETEEASGRPPGEVRRLAAVPAQSVGRTILRPGSIVLHFGGAGALCYELECNSRPVPRWMMDPLAPKAEPLQRGNALRDEVIAVVEDLQPGASYSCSARGRDAAGRAGPLSRLGEYRASVRNYPELLQAAATAPAVPVSSSVWAVPELLKINPKTGELLEGAQYPEHRRHNPIWSGGRVKLSGSRNEFVSFQLAVESAQPLRGIEPQVSKPLFAECKLPEVFRTSGAVRVFREWFVPDDKIATPDRPYYADAMVPVSGAVDLPSSDNPVPGQTVQPFFVDIYIPHDAAPGVHRGAVRVPGREIPIEVEVLPLELPDQLSFVVDLNGYSGVNNGYNVQRGTPEYRALLRSYHRLAQLNRTNLDILGYSHSGTVEPDQTPALEGEGAATRVKSWADFDAHFGPLLDGSAFSDLPRGAVPVTNIYLPLFENWPGDLRKSYRHNSYPLPKTTEEYRQLLTQHALDAGPIEEEFPRDYQDRFSAVAREFAAHFRERGWLRTKYFVYFNDKYFYKDPARNPRASGVSWWLLDEPNHRDDVRAISFFAWLTKRWLKDYADVPITLRTDISYIDFIRDLLAGQIDLDTTAAHFLQKNRYALDHRDRFGKVYWNYASTNHPRDSNVAMRAWCWRAWLAGADGIVPWNTIRGMEAWERAEPLTVFYVGTKFGVNQPFASLRLMAFRRGEQDIEYLALLAQKRGWDREAVRHAVAAVVERAGGAAQASEQDATMITFQNARDAELDELRMRVAATLRGR